MGTSAKATYKIAKAANPMSVKGKTAKVKAKNGKSVKKTTFKATNAFTVKGAQGKVTYKKANKAGKSKVKVASNGKITVAKGLKKGTYKAKVKVTAAGNDNYNKLTKTVTVKVVVK